MTKQLVFGVVLLMVSLALGWALLGDRNISTKSESPKTVVLPKDSALNIEPPHIVRLRRYLQKKGFQVSEHRSGRAIDVDLTRDEFSRLTQLAIQLKHLGWIIRWQVPNNYDHLHIERR